MSQILGLQMSCIYHDWKTVFIDVQRIFFFSFWKTSTTSANAPLFFKINFSYFIGFIVKYR